MNLCATFNCSLSWFKPALLGLHHTPYFRLDGAFRFRTASASLAASVNVGVQTWLAVVHFTIVPHPPPYHQLRLGRCERVRASPASFVCSFRKTLRKERSGSGEGTGQKESLSPTFLRELFYILYKGLTAQEMIVF